MIGIKILNYENFFYFFGEFNGIFFPANQPIIFLKNAKKNLIEKIIKINLLKELELLKRHRRISSSSENFFVDMSNQIVHLSTNFRRKRNDQIRFLRFLSVKETTRIF
jgi:hypothetical protein